MMDNWITNSKMKKILEKISICPNEEVLELNLQQLKKLFFPPFRKVRDCVIISEKSIDRLEATFDKAIELHMDKTGYESSSTETRINCYLENEISMETCIQLALLVTEVWIMQLKQIESTSKFCLIMCSDENYVEIRFHKMHNGENGWLTENLEDYEEAIGYVLV